MVEVPAFGRVADVGRVQQQGQSFGFVDATEERRFTVLQTEVQL